MARMSYDDQKYRYFQVLILIVLVVTPTVSGSQSYYKPYSVDRQWLRDSFEFIKIVISTGSPDVAKSPEGGRFVESLWLLYLTYQDYEQTVILEEKSQKQHWHKFQELEDKADWLLQFFSKPNGIDCDTSDPKMVKETEVLNSRFEQFIEELLNDITQSRLIKTRAIFASIGASVLCVVSVLTSGPWGGALTCVPAIGTVALGIRSFLAQDAIYENLNQFWEDASKRGGDLAKLLTCLQLKREDKDTEILML